MKFKDVIAKLKAASKPSRTLDGFIAQSLGYKKITATKTQAACWVSPQGKPAKIPRYTASFDAARLLAIASGPVGGASWDGTTGAARVGANESCVADTAPIALCIASLYALNDAKDDRAREADEAASDPDEG
ncbi:hypothetical protein [Rhizobium sp. Root482]|uniref:hypothetical protein n=1 Tax=Rhizobium sp. Root482 TaxID=1736543 RepID=UPI0006F93F74|nr:hypothetical protein [Rhizobium sp. Root482]KQY26726.1 hypothetical protein ASD31_00505 [Rhizobium sp. Root482]